MKPAKKVLFPCAICSSETKNTPLLKKFLKEAEQARQLLIESTDSKDLQFKRQKKLSNLKFERSAGRKNRGTRKRTRNTKGDTTSLKSNRERTENALTTALNLILFTRLVKSCVFLFFPVLSAFRFIMYSCFPYLGPSKIMYVQLSCSGYPMVLQNIFAML